MAPFSLQDFQKTPPCPWSQKVMWRKHPVHLQNLQAPQNLPSQPNPEPQRKNQRRRREVSFVKLLHQQLRDPVFSSLSLWKQTTMAQSVRVLFIFKHFRVSQSYKCKNIKAFLFFLDTFRGGGVNILKRVEQEKEVKMDVFKELLVSKLSGRVFLGGCCVYRDLCT